MLGTCIVRMPFWIEVVVYRCMQRQGLHVLPHSAKNSKMTTGIGKITVDSGRCPIRFSTIHAEIDRHTTFQGDLADKEIRALH